MTAAPISWPGPKLSPSSTMPALTPIRVARYWEIRTRFAPTRETPEPQAAKPNALEKSIEYAAAVQAVESMAAGPRVCGPKGETGEPNRLEKRIEYAAAVQVVESMAAGSRVCGSKSESGKATRPPKIME